MLRLLLKATIFLAVIGTVGAIGYKPALKYWEERNRPEWETAKVSKGDATETIYATGTVKPVLQVSVGSFVSGPITDIHVDFNDPVEEGQLLANVDPRLFKAAMSRDMASLETRKAELNRIQAQLQQAKRNRDRGKRLREKNKDFLSDKEMDALHFECEGLEAQLQVTEASIEQAKANLENSKTNLDYTEIKAPVDGVVIDRKIDPGQTLASQFQTPELFIIAPDLRKEIHVFASVSEKDIGEVQAAQKKGLPVTFTVDAHPEDLFTGSIAQIRVSSVETQGVVTYPVVISASNPDLKLLPGMTASISFEVASVQDALKIPNTALRFVPDDARYVVEDDKELLDGSRWRSTDSDEEEVILSAEEKAEAEKEKNKRHIWVANEETGKLRAIEISTGISESRFTVLESGELEEGMKLVTGKKRKR